MNYLRSRSRITPAHNEDWLVTYADTITLLLCLFAFAMATAALGDQTEPPPVQQALPQDQPVEEPAPEPTEGKIPEAELPDIYNGQEMWEEKAIPFPEILPPEIPATVESSSPNGADIVKEGDRITTIELDGTASFAMGSATLSAEGRQMLADITPTLKEERYKDYEITVEGHTDDNPIKTVEFPSNWELSTGRAAAVVRYFLEQGISPGRLRAAGYADTFPKVPNRDEAGNALPDNQARNRRVVIKLEKIDKDEILRDGL